MMVSLATGESSPSTATAKPAEAEPSTSQNDSRKKTTSSCDDPGCNKSASVLKRRIQEGHPNQALTLFAPLGMAEDLTKFQFTLCNEIKAEVKAAKESVDTIPFSDLKVVDSTTSLEERICGLEEKYNIIEKWNPAVMVLKHSPWIKMRLVLNKVAADNISDLFPIDWHPRPLPSNVQEKHFKVLTEVMTEMFLQCGLLIEADIIEMDNYQYFLKVLHHCAVMGNISTTKVTHFIMLMVYMSFCRLKHYSEYMVDRNGKILKYSIWVSLVIISFRITLSMKGEHHSINPYFKDLPSEVRRNLHVAVTRYMEQECSYQNHVQCDLYPTTLTSEVELPSYQHFFNTYNRQGQSRKYPMKQMPYANMVRLSRCLS